MSENNIGKRFFFSSDFKATVKDYYYVDKSLLIKEFLDGHSQVSLITRPRRFGKSLNMDMMKTFFEKTDEDTSVYFKGLKIWECGEKYTSMHGKYPVIHLNFAVSKANTWDELYETLRKIIANEYSRHETALDGYMSNIKAPVYERVARETGTRADYVDALRLLTELLYKRFDVKPIILIDEYDVPIQKGYEGEYFSDVIDFMRNFLNAGLKDNPNLEFAVLTGVTRVSKESLFSGLNNIDVCSVLDDRYSEYYGFTKDEVRAILKDFGAEDKFTEACDWYDGYHFGDVDIFNPWSVESYIKVGFKTHAHWVKTSSLGEIKAVLKNATKETEEKLELVASGKRIKAVIDDRISYDELWEGENIYTLLLACGYLTKCAVTEEEEDNLEEDEYWLVIPNREVGKAYRREILGYMNERYDGVGDFSKNILEALEKADVKTLQSMLNEFMETKLSNWDNDEKFYHGLFMGILGNLGDGYDMKSEREHGLGRADLTVESFGYGLMPRKKAKPGIVVEFKHCGKIEKLNPKKMTKEEHVEARKKLLTASAEDALAQIEKRDYAQDFKRTNSRVLKYGIAFYGKEALVLLVECENGKDVRKMSAAGHVLLA